MVPRVEVYWLRTVFSLRPYPQEKQNRSKTFRAPCRGRIRQGRKSTCWRTRYDRSGQSSARLYFEKASRYVFRVGKRGTIPCDGETNIPGHCIVCRDVCFIVDALLQGPSVEQDILSPTTVSLVAQIARRQFMLLRSSRSSGEKWLYRPVSISLSRANGGISRKARIALCTSWRTGGFCCVLECATW